MLIRSNQLTLNEASSILDNGVYLTETESALNPVAVPVLENQRLGICTVSYNDIQRVCEDYGCYSEDALYAIAEASNVDIDSIAVAIDESDIILDPDIVNEFPQYVVKQLSENSLESIIVESCLDLFIESGNIDYMDLLVEGKKVKFTKPVVAQNAEERAQSIFNNIKQPRAGFDYATGQYEPVIQARNLQGKHDSIISQLGKSGSTNISADNIENGEWKTGLLGERINTAATKKEIANRAISHAISSNKNGSSSGVKMRRIKVDREKLNKLKQLMNGKNEDNPGFISRKIAALRNFYKNFLNQANKEKDEGKISWYKNIARVILKYIDKLLAKLDKTETK